MGIDEKIDALRRIIKIKQKEVIRRKYWPKIILKYVPILLIFQHFLWFCEEYQFSRQSPWWKRLKLTLGHSESIIEAQKRLFSVTSKWLDKIELTNLVLEGWGCLVPLFCLLWGFTPNQWGSRQKTILAGRTPFPSKMKNRKCRFWQFFEKKILFLKLLPKFLTEISVENSGNMVGTS